MRSICESQKSSQHLLRIFVFKRTFYTYSYRGKKTKNNKYCEDKILIFISFFYGLIKEDRKYEKKLCIDTGT